MATIPAAVRATYTTHDPEADVFFNTFDEPVGSRVLEVGGHDSPISTMLAESGFSVLSCDLRPYDGPQHSGHRSVVCDFGRLPSHFTAAWAGKFDCVVCVSALEHFGLGCYGEPRQPYLDVIAARRMYDCLRPGGSAYVLVPFGGMYKERPPHWRVYDHDALYERIIQNFKMEGMHAALAQHVMDEKGVMVPAGSPLTDVMIQGNIDGFPGIVILLKMRK